MLFSSEVTYQLLARTSGEPNTTFRETRIQPAKNIKAMRESIEADLKRRVPDLVSGSIAFNGTKAMKATRKMKALQKYWQEVVRYDNGCCR